MTLSIQWSTVLYYLSCLFVQSDKNALVQLDCTQSTNCVYSRDSPIHVLHVAANSVVVRL